MPDTATATFTGLSGIRGCRFPLARGVSPSAFTLYCLPTGNLDIADGTLTLSQGNNGAQFSGCAVASAYIRQPYDGRWPIMAVHCLDRRWKWSGKTISGDWNRRLADGTVDQATAKTPGELASLLFTALGEGGADTSRMPSNVRPRALWKNSRADLELQALCDTVACEVVLNHQNNSFEVWPLGVGASAPSGVNERFQKCRFAPRANVPGTVQVIGGPSLFQHKLKMAAVLRNYTDSKLKKIDASEMKPSTGWDKESWASFPGVTSTNSRAIVFDQMWRYYRIIGQQDGSVQVPSCPTPVSAIDQYQINDFILDTEEDLEGYKRTLPCYIDGDFWAYTDLPTNASNQRYTGEFKVLKERRGVMFPYPMFKTDSSGGFAEPTLYLTTSYQVIDNNNQLVCIKRSGNVGTGAGGTLTIRRPEIFAIYSSSTVPNQSTNTEAQANQEADSYVALFQQKFANVNASESTYTGILPFSLDGNLAQVSWSIMANGNVETKLCEQEELDTTAVARSERRRRELLAQVCERYL